MTVEKDLVCAFPAPERGPDPTKHDWTVHPVDCLACAPLIAAGDSYTDVHFEEARREMLEARK